MANEKLNGALAGAASGATVGGPYGALAGGALGFLLSQEDESQDYLKQALKAAEGIPLPVLKEMNPELYKVVAQLNPEMEQAVVLGPSATQGIALDPQLKQAQMSALSKLMNITENGGRDAQFNADVNRLQNDVNSNLQGNTQAIQQNMAARGMAGGMSEQVARQMATQQAANRQAQMGLDINAQAQQRALASLMNQGNLAGQISQNEFNQQYQKANAQDAISKFNAQNLQNVNSNNTQSKNNAQQINVGNQQAVANQNVGLSNQAQEYNAGLAQKDYENKLAKLGLTNKVTGALADNSQKQAQNQNDFIGGLFGSVAKYGAK